MKNFVITFLVGALMVFGDLSVAWANKNSYPWTGKSHEHVCNMVKGGNGSWGREGWVGEAKRRGLNCDKFLSNTFYCSGYLNGARDLSFDLSGGSKISSSEIISSASKSEVFDGSIHKCFKNSGPFTISFNGERNFIFNADQVASNEGDQACESQYTMTLLNDGRLVLDALGARWQCNKRRDEVVEIWNNLRNSKPLDVASASSKVVRLHEYPHLLTKLPKCLQSSYKDNCYANHTFAEGSRYFGEFQRNKQNGKGAFFYANGNKHVGEYKNGKRNGFGIFTWPSGAKYNGHFNNNEFDGQGILNYANGNKYIGEFKKGKRSGQGTLKYIDGNVYIGTFKSDKMDGKGTLILSDSNKYNGDRYQGEFKNNQFNGYGVFTFNDGKSKEGVWKNNEFLYAKKLTPNNSAPNAKPKVNSSAALTAAQRKAEELEQQLAALKATQKQQQQTISSDTQIPLITITSVSSSGPSGTIEGRVTDNTGVGEVKVDGQLIQVDDNGNFTAATYVPEGGVSVSVEAVDLAGLSSSMSVRLDRVVTQSAAFSFDRLNPIKRKALSNPDALALIIGVADYKETNATAVYADSDAKVFTDYAVEKLGVPRGRIKTLVNDGADEKDVLLAVKRWLSRGASAGKTDIYVFFAGHGLASDDGKQMYLLPYDGAPELLEKTAILREELFSDIASANPRSVTVFLDTCYSGTTRGTDMLIASRPIALKALKQSLPDNFTVLTAAAGDQTAKPLEEAKHGMFSYFLMKGMEGDADANQDNQITAGELHAYVQENVVQQSSGSQTPELQGDADRVLVQFQ